MFRILCKLLCQVYKLGIKMRFSDNSSLVKTRPGTNFSRLQLIFEMRSDNMLPKTNTEKPLTIQLGWYIDDFKTDKGTGAGINGKRCNISVLMEMHIKVLQAESAIQLCR